MSAGNSDDKDPKGAGERPAGDDKRAAREARRAEALRANLKKRKAQAQARADDPPPPPKGPDSAA